MFALAQPRRGSIRSPVFNVWPSSKHPGACAHCVRCTLFSLLLFNTSIIQQELIDAGFGGVEIRAAPTRTEIVIRASRPQEVLGDKGRRIREMQSVIQKRFGFVEGSIELYAEKLHNLKMSAQAQAESLKFKLVGGLAVRRACYGVMRNVMEGGAKGVEVVVSARSSELYRACARHRICAGETR